MICILSEFDIQISIRQSLLGLSHGRSDNLLSETTILFVHVIFIKSLSTDILLKKISIFNKICKNE